jgi:preprotein translocase subunit YajC
MDLHPASLFLAVVAFVIAFGIAKFISVRRRRRNVQQRQQLARGAESRQVRRSRERQDRGR